MLGNEKRIILLDGAMGSLLQKMELMTPAVPEAINLTHPEVIIDIHRQYIRAGAEIIYASTFGVNRYKLMNSGYKVEELIDAALDNAKEARRLENPNVKIALDCSPVGKMLKPNGEMPFEEAYDIYREVLSAGERAGADMVVFETFTDLLEIKAGILAAREKTSLPVMASLSFESNGRTFAGVPVASAALTLSGLGLEAIGINCSLGPEQILPLVQEMAEWTDLPLLVKPNAGLPNLKTGEYDMKPAEFAQIASAFADLGVRYLGGCCGTTPEFIRELKAILKDREPAPRKQVRRAALCSGEQVVELDRVRVVGERINPTGKKRFKAALETRDIPYILGQALEQTGAGAEILDVNVGMPGIDEPAMMTEVVEALQSVTGAPLQIDSSDPKAIEAALRIYNGKALVNSVNGEEKNLETILPIVKKYGAAVIGLTLDDQGLPQTAEDRLRIAEKIIHRAAEYGIPYSDIVIDCLTLTVSAQQDQALETLRALKMVKEKFGVKTVLGVSNISFGLPNRELINTTFLTMALTHGLDLPIMNPNNRAMMDAVMAFNVLNNSDLHSERYIAAQSETPPAQKAAPTATTLDYAVESGLRQAAADATTQLLETKEPAEIIDTILIPTLERVGIRFEKGEAFLPQLIQSAGAAQASFEVIKNHLAKSTAGTNEMLSKGKIVLATVKGDIHDIGKNIVKVILENSGYQVIDLGKDVQPELVAETVQREKAGLVGLSALMTTTVKGMEETIRLLKAIPGDGKGCACKIMVGGAVLTEEYALSIGADYFGKDAKAAMDIAKAALGS